MYNMIFILFKKFEKFIEKAKEKDERQPKFKDFQTN